MCSDQCITFSGRPQNNNKALGQFTIAKNIDVHVKSRLCPLEGVFSFSTGDQLKNIEILSDRGLS